MIRLQPLSACQLRAIRTPQARSGRQPSESRHRDFDDSSAIPHDDRIVAD